MADHECKHETDLALMAAQMKTMCDDLKEIKTVMIGNGKVGVKTQQELNKQAIRRLYWLFAGSFGGLSILILVVNFVK